MPDMAIKNKRWKAGSSRSKGCKSRENDFSDGSGRKSFADITRELNRQAIATCDEQKLSRGDQVQFQRFDTIKKETLEPYDSIGNRPG